MLGTKNRFRTMWPVCLPAKYTVTIAKNWYIFGPKTSATCLSKIQCYGLSIRMLRVCLNMVYMICHMWKRPFVRKLVAWFQIIKDSSWFHLIFPTELLQLKKEKQLCLKKWCLPPLRYERLKTAGTEQIIEEICVYYGVKDQRIRIYAKQS